MNESRFTRIEELALDRALVGLSSADELELEGLQAAAGATLATEYELAAAAIDRALAPPDVALPAELHARLIASAAKWCASASHAPVLRTPVREARARRMLPAWSGWLVAAAAAVLALSLWLGRGGASDPARLRNDLLARAATLKRDWSEPGTPTGATGDVLWSQELQQGVMRIAGLARNDPTVEQYQLWIFDEAQEHPIDGGVFDVVGGEVLIPIDAKLRIAQPKLFAITREKPGGVVVSDQKRIVLVAPI